MSLKDVLINKKKMKTSNRHKTKHNATIKFDIDMRTIINLIFFYFLIQTLNSINN